MGFGKKEKLNQYLCGDISGDIYEFAKYVGLPIRILYSESEDYSELFDDGYFTLSFAMYNNDGVDGIFCNGEELDNENILRFILSYHLADYLLDKDKDFKIKEFDPELLDTNVCSYAKKIYNINASYEEEVGLASKGKVLKNVRK